MQAVRDGDVSQLGQLFERYHARLFEFLSRMTGNRVAAEDLVQDVFVRILKYRATYRDDGRFETWLFRIARNARADYFPPGRAGGFAARFDGRAGRPMRRGRRRSSRWAATWRGCAGRCCRCATTGAS